MNEDDARSEVTDAEPDTRAGHVALVGRPNVGKSTLLNALVGEKLSIVTPKAQTTRESVTGILTTDRMQAIFVDTPGLLEPKYALQRAMHETALEVLAPTPTSYCCCSMPRGRTSCRRQTPVEALRRRRADILVVVNKMDAAGSEGFEALRPVVHRGARAGAASDVGGSRGRRPGAAHGAREGAAESPFFYPADELAVQPVRFFVAELIRETIFESTSRRCRTRPSCGWRSIGRGSAGLHPGHGLCGAGQPEADRHRARRRGVRELGRRSREKIEAFVGSSVYLDLWIKTLPNWRAKVDTLRYLGYRLPTSMAAEGDGSSAARRGGSSSGRRRDRPKGD
jgi:GTPase